MRTYLLERRMRVLGPGVRGWGLLLLVAAWSALAMNATFGFTNIQAAAVLLPLVLAVPMVLLAALALRRTPAPSVLRLSAGWSVLLIAALVAAAVASGAPAVGLVMPVIAISAFVCSRHPAAAVVTAFFLTGSFGTLEALTPVPVGESVDLVLAGVWGGTLWGYVFGRRGQPIFLWPGTVLAAAYVAITAVSIAWAEQVSGGLFGFRSSTWYMAAFLVIAYARWDPEIHRRMASGFVAVAAAVGAYATFRWVVGPADAEVVLALSTNPEYQFVDGDLVLFGSFPSGKALAAWTGIAIPFCVAFALTFKNRWRYLAALAAGLCSIGMLGSEARAGFVAAVAGVALVLLLYQLSRGVPGLHLGVTLAAVLAIGGGGALLLTQKDESSLERYTLLVEDPASVPSYQARLFKWRTAVEEIDERPGGHGIGTAGAGEQRYRRFTTIASSNLDNSYLKVAYEQGLFVLGLFALTLILLLAGLVRRSIFAADRQRAGLGIGASGVLLSLGILMFSGMFIEGLNALAAWLLIGLGVAQFTTPRSDSPNAEPAH